MPSKAIDDLNLSQINQTLESAPPQRILRWAWAQFAQDMAASSSFQSQSLPLLHMIATLTPEMPIYFLDTGFHFSETLAFRDRLVLEWDLNVHNLTPKMGHSDFFQHHGDLHRSNPEFCCFINKVEPLREAKTGNRAWITGIRRDQTPQRAQTPIVAADREGRYKICPMANWTDRDVWRYINQHDLPVHPLLEQGYLSIGCAPCTQPIDGDGDPREGRWAGSNKTECGLHIGSSMQTEGMKQPISSLTSTGKR